MGVTASDLDWGLDLAPRLRWTFAKTMPMIPHEYVVRDEVLEGEDFERAVRVIRTFGEPGSFGHRTFIYLRDPSRGVKWWTMGYPIKETTIINQAIDGGPATNVRPGASRTYDEVSTEYDSWYETPEALAENEQVRKLILEHFGAYAPYTLDAGCGTGLLLDLGITSPLHYIGVDPSRGMLNELIRKHPAARVLEPAKIEDVIDRFKPGEFELVISIFGSPSYMHPSMMEKLRGLSRGLTVFGHYRNGYWPAFEGEPEHSRASLAAATELFDREALSRGARRFDIGNFVMTVLYGSR